MSFCGCPISCGWLSVLCAGDFVIGDVGNVALPWH